MVQMICLRALFCFLILINWYTDVGGWLMWTCKENGRTIRKLKGKKEVLVNEEETSKTHLLALHGSEWPSLSGCSHACISLRRCACCEDVWLQHMVPLIKAIGEVVCGIRGTTKDVKAACLFWASWSTGACCKERQLSVKWGYVRKKQEQQAKKKKEQRYTGNQCFKWNLKERKIYNVTILSNYIFVDSET